MFTGLSEFLLTGIKVFIPEAKNLEVLFATYNEVTNYASGVVPAGKEGVSIRVQNGNLHYSREANMIFSPRLSDAVEGMKAMQRDAREALSTIVPSVANVPNKPDFIAFVYAGLSAFDEAVDLARKIKQENPLAKIIITTCDCGLNDKKNKLLPLLGRKEIDAVVVSDECGGRFMMKDILEGVLKL